ncbi:MAG: hypothetical protein IPM24_25200 [Bryobacterales bacterium]|nr:hypothetical protein [Bryobacterales bacterium]
MEVVEASASALADFRTGPAPPKVVESLDWTGVGLKGPTTDPSRRRPPERQRGVAQETGSVRELPPDPMLPGTVSRFNDTHIDMVIFRENTEDLYSGLEHEVVQGVVESIKIITRQVSLRIAERRSPTPAVENRKKVTAIHKANIMKMSDGLFLRCCREVAERYP